MTTSDIEQVINQLQRDGSLPTHITDSTRAEMAKSLGRYFSDVSSSKIQEFTDKAKSLLEQSLKTEQVQGVTVGESQSTARGKLLSFIEDNSAKNIGETMNMDFFMRIAREVAHGSASHMAQNFDQTRVDEFPALEFHRVYDREVPRGSPKDPNGPDNAWDDANGRWTAACEDAGDDDALKVFNDTGRMVALKSSDVWQSLGDGAGGYEDTLGNPFAPFAFNSGFDTDEVPYDECVSLGLIDDGDDVEPAEIDFKDLLGAENL